MKLKKLSSKIQKHSINIILILNIIVLTFILYQLFSYGFFNKQSNLIFEPTTQLSQNTNLNSNKNLIKNKVNLTKQMPKDRIKENQIKVYNNKIILFIDNPEWSRFTNTNSMIPFLDEGANAIQIKPKSKDDLQIGDIISYKYKSSIIIHRIISIGKDNLGWYATVKGDNNTKADPHKVRYNEIERVLVGIIY